MEALAVAYLALITVGPLVFSRDSHWLLGRMLGLSRGQSAWIGFSGLLMLGIIPAIGQTLMPYAQDLKQFLDERADNAIPVTVAPAGGMRQDGSVSPTGQKCGPSIIRHR